MKNNFKFLAEPNNCSDGKYVMVHKFVQKNNFKGSWDAT